MHKTKLYQHKRIQNAQDTNKTSTKTTCARGSNAPLSSGHPVPQAEYDNRIATRATEMRIPALSSWNQRRKKKNERTVTLPGVGPSRFPRARTTSMEPSCATNRVKQPHLNTCNRNANTVLAFLGSTEVRDAGTSDSEPCSTPSVPYSTEICKRQKTSAPSHFPVLAHHVSRENEPHPVQHHSES